MILRPDIKDDSPGRNEAQDNAYKCDSDFETEEDEEPEPAEPVNEDGARRSVNVMTCLMSADTTFISFRESSTASLGVLRVGAWKT